MKNISRFTICLLFSATVSAMGPKAPQGISLLVVPAKPALVQLGMDMAAQQHALLMTYAPNTPTHQMFIHIWDGSKWLPVPQSSFERGTFIKNKASRVLVVGEENALTAALIEKALVWSPEVLHLGSDNITELINQMGRLYGFKRSEWEWIARRYALQLEDLNQERVQTSWYDENKASDLPPSESPWKAHSKELAPQPPETSLTPLMPPAASSRDMKVEVMEVEVTEVKVIEVKNNDLGSPVDFSLELE